MPNTSSAGVVGAAGPPAGPDALGAATRLFYRHGSPRILTGIALGFCALRLALGDWSAWDVAVAGLLVALWPLQEWLIHVCILHFKPVRLFGWTFDPLTPRTHRAHHRDPWEIDLVFIPIHVFLYVPVVLGAGWLAFRPIGPQVITGVAVYFLLSLHYEWVHFLTHTRVRPRSAFYRRLRRNHRQHHFKNEHYWYGVTMLGGDRLLRTAPEVSAVPTSPTCRSLEAEAPASGAP